MASLLTVDNLSTHIYTAHGVVRAVDDVHLEVRPGEAVALVGESGCGKSMTALSIMRLTRPPVRNMSGTIMFDGADLLTLAETQMRKLRGGRLAMVFQDPMTFLNPLMRVGDQIAEAVLLHRGGTRKTARAAAHAALERVHIPSAAQVLDYYPHQLSGGMRQRVLIAMAISCRPALLIADEPTTALDVTIQAQIMALLSEVRREIGSAMLLITHDLGLVAEHCDRIYVMYAGRIVEHGDVYTIFGAPSHPYTRALLKSTLSIDYRTDAFETIEGQPPDLARLPAGCRFNPRCSNVLAECRDREPPLIALGGERHSRCWLANRGEG